jgi:hypothetical protein
MNRKLFAAALDEEKAAICSNTIIKLLKSDHDYNLQEP